MATNHMAVSRKEYLDMLNTAHKLAKDDEAYQRFMSMVATTDWYKDKQKFDKAAKYSISPLYWHETELERAERREKYMDKNFKF